jgi:hypothetical protein
VLLMAGLLLVSQWVRQVAVPRLELHLLGLQWLGLADLEAFGLDLLATEQG